MQNYLGTLQEKMAKPGMENEKELEITPRKRTRNNHVNLVQSLTALFNRGREGLLNTNNTHIGSKDKACGSPKELKSADPCFAEQISDLSSVSGGEARSFFSQPRSSHDVDSPLDSPTKKQEQFLEQKESPIKISRDLYRDERALSRQSSLSSQDEVCIYSAKKVKRESSGCELQPESNIKPQSYFDFEYKPEILICVPPRVEENANETPSRVSSGKRDQRRSSSQSQPLTNVRSMEPQISVPSFLVMTDDTSVSKKIDQILKSKNYMKNPTAETSGEDVIEKIQELLLRDSQGKLGINQAKKPMVKVTNFNIVVPPNQLSLFFPLINGTPQTPRTTPQKPVEEQRKITPGPSKEKKVGQGLNINKIISLCNKQLERLAKSKSRGTLHSNRTNSKEGSINHKEDCTKLNNNFIEIKNEYSPEPDILLTKNLVLRGRGYKQTRENSTPVKAQKEYMAKSLKTSQDKDLLPAIVGASFGYENKQRFDTMALISSQRSTNEVKSRILSDPQSNNKQCVIDSLKSYLNSRKNVVELNPLIKHIAQVVLEEKKQLKSKLHRSSLNCKNMADGKLVASNTSPEYKLIHSKSPSSSSYSQIPVPGISRESSCKSLWNKPTHGQEASPM